MKSTIPRVAESEKGPYENPKLKGFAVESGTVPRVQVKEKSNVRPFEVSLTENAEDPRPYKKRTILLDDKGSITQKGVPTKRVIFGGKACKIIEKAGAQLVSTEGLKTNKQVMEVTRRPDAVSLENLSLIFFSLHHFYLLEWISIDVYLTLLALLFYVNVAIAFKISHINHQLFSNSIAACTSNDEKGGKNYGLTWVLFAVQ